MSITLILLIAVIIYFVVKKQKKNGNKQQPNLPKERIGAVYHNPDHPFKELPPLPVYVRLPDYEMRFTYLELAGNKLVKNLFDDIGRSFPKIKIRDIKYLHEECLNSGWLYETKGNESAINSFTKKDLTKILEENNLPVNGNKPDLVERIVSNLGFDKFQEIGEVNDKVKLTDLGKAKLEEYYSKINNQSESLQNIVYDLFINKKVAEACLIYIYYRGSNPYYRNNDYEYDIDLQHYNYKFLECSKIRNNEIIKKFEIPEKHHDDILSTMCMFWTFRDFDYEVRFIEIFDGIKEALIKSDLIINKEKPFSDMYYLLLGSDIPQYSDDNIYKDL